VKHKLWVQGVDQAFLQIIDQVDNQVWLNVQGEVAQQVWSEVWFQVQNQVKDQVWDQYNAR
jgi:hypothetical protein